MSVTPKLRDLPREWNEQKSKAHLSVDEKYDMLQLRDKIIRENIRNPSGPEDVDFDSDTDAVVITGVCPEMCPEKERYERVKQGRVDSFEKRTRMIKDFSRQAADQDMPLPSELRTPAALRATMDFLLHEIIADPPANPETPSGWYDFVWRRVRAIRKEITQQRLTGPQIAGILEDMCRFHIIAFHMFCEADQNQFAPKLNLENLNDCLATLARIYAGMEGSTGEHSPNIAEFRAYEMMLRVWTGKLDLAKTTAEVEKLPDTVKRSPEIVFARRVISAVNNRLFSEYLQLMATADYVTACLMHYSLPMMQAKALDFLAVATGIRSNKIASNGKVSADFFSGMLGLPNNDQLIRFTSYHGLLYESGSDTVFFPLGFVRSKDPKSYPRIRSTDVIEKKAAGRSLAEIVAKKRTTEIPVPDVIEIESFNEEGLYVGADPFTVSFEKENVDLQGSSVIRHRQLAVSRVPVKLPLRVQSPVVTLPRPAFPRSPQTASGSTSPRFPFNATLGVQSSPSLPRFPLPSPLSQSTASSSSTSDRKRTRTVSVDEDTDLIDSPEKPKRLHYDDAIAGEAVVTVPQSPARPTPPEFSTPVTPDSPALSRQTSKLTPLSRGSSRSAEKLPEEAAETVYPMRTHLQLIRARTVCQASGPLGCFFKAWRDHATRYRRPSNYFGQVDASPEQKAAAQQVQREEIQRLTWMKYPIRSTLLGPRDNGFDCCTLLFLYAAGRDGEEMEEWLRTKLGDPDPSEPSSIRIITYEEGGRVLRIVFVSLPTWNRKAASEISDEISAVGSEMTAVLLYALDEPSLTAAKELLSHCDIRPALPIGLFCHDAAVSHLDMETDLPGHLLLDVFVAQLAPTAELSTVLWEAIRAVIARRVAVPVRRDTTLLRLVAEMYCCFLKLYRTLRAEYDREKEAVDGCVHGIWNAVVEEYFGAKSVDVFVDTERDCDWLVDLVVANELGSFLKVDEVSLWETPGQFPEVFPFLLAETSSCRRSSYHVFAAISEKVLTLSAMATVSDPVVRQNPKFLPDFELLLRDWLEKLQPEASLDRPSAASSVTGDGSRASSDREDSSSGYDTHRDTSSQPKVAVDRGMMDRVRQDTKNVSKWLSEVSRDLKKLDSS